MTNQINISSLYDNKYFNFGGKKVWNLEDNAKVAGSFFLLPESPQKKGIILEQQDYDCPLFEVS